MGIIVEPEGEVERLTGQVDNILYCRSLKCTV